MSATRPGAPETPEAAPPLRFPTPAPLAAALAGSATGLAAALLFGGPLAGLLPPSRPIPGYAALHGIDIRRETFRLLLAVLLPIAGGFAAGALRRADRGSARDPAAHAAGRASAGRRSFSAAAIGGHAIAAWTFVVAAFPDFALRSPLLLFFVLAACSAALAFLLGGGRIGEGSSFLGAAALILPLAFVGQRPIPLAAAAASGAVVLPTLAALGGRRSALERALRAVTVAVLIPGSVAAVAAAAVLGPPPVADLFEDGHELLPASEYLRGERPYRDVVPGHGLISDGGFDAAAMRVFGDDYRGYSRGRKVLGATFWPAIYAVGLGATGSPLVGLGVAVLSLAAFCQYAFVRAIPSLAALALTLAASRTGDRRWWTAAGVALAVSLFVSVDFAVYAAAAAGAGLWVARGDRSAAFGSLSRGALAAGGAGAAVLVALGVLPEFARTTFGLVPSLLPAYAQGFPPALPLGSGAAATLYAAAGTGVLLLGALLPGGKRIAEAARALPPVCAWIAAAMLAVLERQHLNYPYFAVPALVLLLARWIREAAPDRVIGNLAAATVVGGFALVHGAPSLPSVVGGAIPPRPVGADLAPIAAPRRAEGAVFRSYDRVLVARTADLMRRAGFREADTWLDFANEPGLYFLFDRRCPIRYYEVPFYESDEAQREVIAAVSGNPRVRAVLMTGSQAPIDGVPNAVRAPRVAAFIAERFRPFLREDGVEFWIRKEESPPAGPDDPTAP